MICYEIPIIWRSQLRVWSLDEHFLLVFSVTQAQSMYSLWCGCRIMWGCCHNFSGAAILLLLASTLPPCVFGGQKSNNLALNLLMPEATTGDFKRNQLWWILWFLSCSDVFSQSRTCGSRTQGDEVFDDVIAQPRDSEATRGRLVCHRQKGPNHDNSPKPKWRWNGRSVFSSFSETLNEFYCQDKKTRNWVVPTLAMAVCALKSAF